MSFHKWLLLASVSSGWAPVAYSLFRGSLGLLWVWPTVLLAYCFCSGSQSMWDFRCTLKSRVSISCSPGSRESKPYQPLKANCFGGLSSWLQDPWGEEPDVGLRPPRSLGRTSAVVILLQCVGHPARVWVLTIPWLFPSYPSHCSSFFVPWVVEDRFMLDSCLSHQWFICKLL